MDWVQWIQIFGPLLALVAINFSLVSMIRLDVREIANDIHCDTKVFQLEITRWKEEIQKESKDFLGVGG